MANATTAAARNASAVQWSFTWDPPQRMERCEIVLIGEPLGY